MAKGTFILVSLEDSKSRELASAIQSNSAKKILDYLGSKEEASATEISKELSIPLATVEYNLNLLLRAGLLESIEFKWSEKGKKVDIYKVAKKLIIIAPKGTENLVSKLSGLLPAVFVTVIGSIAIYLKSSNAAEVSTELLAKSADSGMMESAPSLAMRAADIAPVVTNVNNPLAYFILGASLAILSILFYLCYGYWRSRK